MIKSSIEYNRETPGNFIMLRIFLAMVALATQLSTLQAQPDRAVLIIHGGLGVANEKELAETKRSREDYEKGLAEALYAGWLAHKEKGPLDGVEAAIRVMEDSPLFNAGKGAVLTKDGRTELDASIMEGAMVGKGVGKKDSRKRAGAVTGVTHVKNPISAARAVLEMPDSKHALLAGAGAEEYVLREDVRKKYSIVRVDNHYFWTERRLREIQKHGTPFGTVGCVAVKDGRIVAGTSTGGLSGKWPGRIGDSPIFGAGNYADDRACGVSGTGTGELFLRHVVAHDVIARMIYKKVGVKQAAKEAIDQLPDEPGGVGGLIALDADGRFAFAMSGQSDGMNRGLVTAEGDIYVALYANDPWKKMIVSKPVVPASPIP